MGEVQPVKIITVKPGNTLPQKYTVPPVARQNHPLYDGIKDKKAERLVAINKSNQVVGVAGYVQPGNGLNAAGKTFDEMNRRYYKREPELYNQHLLYEAEKRLSPNKRIDLQYLGSTQPGVGTKLIDKLKSVGRTRGVKTIDGYTAKSVTGFYKKQGATITKNTVTNSRGNLRYEFVIKTRGRRQ